MTEQPSQSYADMLAGTYRSQRRVLEGIDRALAAYQDGTLKSYKDAGRGRIDVTAERIASYKEERAAVLEFLELFERDFGGPPPAP